MKKIFIIFALVLIAGFAFAEVGLSGSSKFAYTDEGVYSNSTSFDYAMPVKGPVSIGLEQSIAVDNGVVSSGWPTFTASYTVNSFTVTGKLNESWKGKLAYDLNLSDIFTLTPAVSYTDVVNDPAKGTADFVGTFDVASGSVFGPVGLSGTFTADELIDSPTYDVAGSVDYKFGGDKYLKPYYNTAYNFQTEDFTSDFGVKASVIAGIVFEMNYVLFDDTWCASVKVSF